MSDWINKLKADMATSEQERQHQAQALHSAASRTFDLLKRQLDADIEKINQEFGRKLGRITLTMPDSNKLLISKGDFPAYYITVTFDVAGKALKIEREIKASLEQKPKSAHPEYLKLSVNTDGDLLISREGQDLSWDALPEILLKPIIIGEKI